MHGANFQGRAILYTCTHKIQQLTNTSFLTHRADYYCNKHNCHSKSRLYYDNNNITLFGTNNNNSNTNDISTDYCDHSCCVFLEEKEGRLIEEKTSTITQISLLYVY